MLFNPGFPTLRIYYMKYNMEMLLVEFKNQNEPWEKDEAFRLTVQLLILDKGWGAHTIFAAHSQKMLTAAKGEINLYVLLEP